jgi:glucose/mannose-6-phosphate isomerase
MKTLIADLPKHITQALEIADNTPFKATDKTIQNVLITGLGGSGIGGTIVAELMSGSCTVPVTVNKNYHLPAFVNENTLVIANSYSGNTEETLAALDEALQRGAEVAIATSGGRAKEIAEEKALNHFVVPGGNPPRSMLGYSLTLQFVFLNRYGLTPDVTSQLKAASALLLQEQEAIKEAASALAGKMQNTWPIIYAIDGFEGVAVRLRQQLNENSKMLCHHAVVPEMNHNELVGWENGTEKQFALFLRNESDYDRNQKRVEINKTIISRFTNNVAEVWSKGNSTIENAMYHIHYGDWLSYYLSELNQVDIMAIDSIDFLKAELAKF